MLRVSVFSMIKISKVMNLLDHGSISAKTILVWYFISPTFLYYFSFLVVHLLQLQLQHYYELLNDRE